MAQTALPKIVQDLKDCLQALKKEYQDGQVPITDDSVPLHKFCVKLEYMLQIDKKARNNVWRGRHDYWDYIYNCLSKIKGLNDGVRFVRAMNEVKSSLGRGRALIRYSLVHHRLGDSLQQCFTNVKATSEFYKPNSVLMNPIHYSAFLNDLYDLNDVQFDLAPTGHNLDTAWPTFARKTPGGAHNVYLWTPPSRSSSISSLSSQPSTTDCPSSPQSESSVFGTEEQYQKLLKEFEECEQLNRQLRAKIEHFEKDNEEMNKLALETEDRMSALQSDLERRNQNLQYQVDKISKQLKSKEEELKELEDAKERSKEAEKLNTDLYARIDVLNTQHESREKLLLESERMLQEKLQTIDRELSDFKLQVQSLKGEVDSRRSSEERKVNHVQELEAKVNILGGKNVELLTRMENMVHDKDEKVSSHFESANKVHDLLAKLEGVEHQNITLKSANEVLNRKVQDLEDTRVKSNTETEILRGSLEDRTFELSQNSHQVSQRVEGLEVENQRLITKNSELTLQVEKLEKMVQKLENHKQTWEEDCNKFKTDIENYDAKEKRYKEDHVKLKSNFVGLERTKQVLEKQVKSLENNNQEMIQESQKLKSQIKKREKEISELKEKVSQTANKNHKIAQSLGILAQKIPELENDRDNMRQDYDGLLSALSDLLNSSGVDLESHLQSSPVKELRSIDDSILLNCENTLDKVKAVIDDRSSKVQELMEVHESVKHLQAEVQTALQQLHEQEDDHRKTKQELKIANERINKFESEVTIVTNELVSHKQKAEQAQVEVGQLQKSVNDHDINTKSIHIRLQVFENNLKEVKKEKETIAIQLGEAKKTEMKLNEVVSQLEAENQVLVKAKNALQDSFAKEKQVTKRLEDTVEDLRRTCDENISMEQVIEERKKEQDDRVEFLTHQFNMVKEDLEKANLEKLRLTDELKLMSEEHATMKERVEMAQKERNETKEVNHALNLEIATIDEQINSVQEERIEIGLKLQQISDETTMQLAEKNARISALEAELDQTKIVQAEAESKVTKIQKAVEEHKTEYSKLEERSREVEEQLGSMQCVKEQEVSALKFQLSSEAMQYQEKLQSYKAQESKLDQLREKSREQDQLIESQQSEVAHLKAQFQHLKAEGTVQMSKTAAKEKDFVLLQDSLAGMTKMLEDQKVANMNLEEELFSLKKDKEGHENHMEKQLALATNDNLELKKNIIKLVQEKDTLWQWTDKLEHNRKMKASERWLDDREVKKCMQCETEFTLVVRRHHCRVCGHIFCSRCCNSYIQGAQSRNKVRVCEQCFVIHYHSLESDNLNTSLLSQDGDAIDDVNNALINARLRMESYSSVNSESGAARGVESGIGPLLGPGDLEQGHLKPSQLDDTRDTRAKFIIGSASSTTTMPTPPTVTASTEDNSISVIDSPTDVAQLQIDKDRENPVIVLDSPMPGTMEPVTKDEDSKGSEEPDFDIISDQEVLSIKDDDLPSSPKATSGLAMENSVVSAVMTTNQLEAGFGGDGEMQVKAGHSHSIPVQLDEPGIILCWEFASAPKTIAFSVTYKQTEMSDTFEELIPLCKCNSHRHAVQGELISRKAGIYTLVFDNHFSRFTAKTVKYSLQIKRPEAAY